MSKIAHKSFLHRFCISILLVFAFIGVFAQFLANEKPILQVDQHYKVHFFPIVQKNSSIFELAAPIPYSPQNMDMQNMGATPPFQHQKHTSIYHRHWLGTDLIGRDVLSALIHGAQTSLLIGCAATMLAALLGIFIGGFAGYFGDHSLKTSRIRRYVLLILSLFLLFYFIQLQKFNFFTTSSILAFVLLMLLQFVLICGAIAFCNVLLKKLESRFSWKQRNLPLDHYLSRIIEIVSTLPLLFIIITLSAIFRPSIWNVVLIIGLTGWTGVARFTRTEFLSIKNQNFILSAKALGLRSQRILFAHILPNAYRTILTALTFAFAGIILAEATLSFLGVGLPPEEVSWGSMLAMARQQPSAWWLVVLPSVCIFLVIFSMHYLATSHQKRK